MAKAVSFGVVGAMGIGRSHRRAIHDVSGCELTACCDVNPDFVQQVCEEEGVEGFTDPVKMYKSGLVDAVTVGTPHWFHPDLTVKAFRAGLHVLSEKPMAVTVSGCDKMIAAQKKAGKVLQVVYQRRYVPVYQKFHRMVRKGTLGRIQRVEMICANYRTQPYYDSGAWRGTWAGEGGGVLLNQAPHPIDAMLYVICMDPVKLFAVNSTAEHKIETEDRSDAMMWFGNGAVGYMHVSTNEWPQEDRLEVTGTMGRLILEHGRLLHIKNKVATDKAIRAKGEAWGKPPKPAQKDVTPKKSGPPYSHYPIIKDFARAIRTGSTPAVTGEEGRRSVEIMNAAILSSYTGEPVEVPVNRRKYDALMKKLIAGSKFKPAVKKRRKKTRSTRVR